MQKLSRKLLISIMTLAFAVITLGASTFAWFTLSNKAEVQTFQTTVTAGAGIEISLDDTLYKSTITTNEIQQKIDSKGSRVLDDVTSPDGKTFKTIASNTQFDDTDTGFVEFNLFFRSPEDNVKVYLLNNSYISSTGVDWIPDADFNIKEGTAVKAGDTLGYKLYGANALRISTEEYTATEQTPRTNPINYSIGSNPANIFEIDPMGTGNQRLDSELKTTYGSVDYYNAKYPLTQIDTGKAQLPATVLNQSAFKNPTTLMDTQSQHSVATLSAEYKNPNSYFYSQIKVRIWLEGWDPDMYNSIMADTISIYLNFGGSAVVPELSVTPTSLDLTMQNSGTFVYTANKIDFEPTVVSMDDLKVTVSVDAATNTVTVTKVDGATATESVDVRISIPGFNNVTPINVPITLPGA